MRDDIIVQMQQYLDNNTLQILDSVLVDLFEEVDMQRRETLPAEVRNSIDEKNKYIIQLFIYKKIESVTKDHNSIPGSDQNAADIHG